MSMYLTPDEVAEITDCKRRDTQCERLAKMGIPFRPSFAGRPLVERAAVLTYKDRPQKKRSEPNFDAIKVA